VPKPYTDHFHEQVSATTGAEPLYLIRITHPQLAVPVRYVRDTQNLTITHPVHGVEEYFAAWFEVMFPDDVSGRLPRAPIRFDNLGRELTQWIDASAGGRGAQIELMQVMRDEPDVIEADITLDLVRVSQNGAFVTGELGYEDILNKPALVESYRPDNTPGLF